MVRGRSAVGLLAGAGWLACAVASAAPPLITGTLGRAYELGGDRPMRMPTGVAVAADGTVFVADGANDRVLEFAADGTLRAALTAVGDAPLSRPLSVKVAPDRRLWIADTGHGRVLVRAADGTLAERIDVPPVGGRAADVSDVVLAADGRTLWVVDNDAHALIWHDLTTGSQARVGQLGEALGQFHYPFVAAAAAGGDLVVADVLNGRVAVLDAAGRPVRSIGSYGVHPGQLYRPCGVAVDAAGRVWVSDLELGVVQVFSAGGTFIDVLREEGGGVLRLAMPTGLAFDAAGRLYVAELGADRVRQVHVQVGRLDELPQRPPPPPPGRQPRQCTACHLEWMSPLDEGRATELIALPPPRRDEPRVSTADSCLSCHGGPVVDSRRRVWLEPGHHTGVAPPPGISVPARLPLVDGKLACRTCHSAHTRGGSGNLLKDAVFLRVERELADLCTACHPGFDGGRSAGMHPLGLMDAPLPAALRPHPPGGHGTTSAAGPVTCYTCHVGHGAEHDRLLRVSVDDNGLCLTCHTALAPELFDEDRRSRHGRRPVLDGEQRAVARELGTRVGPQGELLCVTCHATHHATQPRHLLAFDPAQADVCGTCHAAQQPIRGSSHDLTASQPDLPNALGVTAAVGGACSVCHAAHRYVRPSEVTSELDPRGRCLACHAPGGPAGDKVLGPANHPGAQCVHCHDPHQPGAGRYLPGPPVETCGKCHTDHLAMVGGPHDMTAPPRPLVGPFVRKARAASLAWPAASRATGDVCLGCHAVHAPSPEALWRAGLAVGATAEDARCLPCHSGSAPGSHDPHTLVHPLRGPSLAAAGPLPLCTAPDGTLALGCRTCHDVHRATPGSAALLRRGVDGDSRLLCKTCHPAVAGIETIGHSVEALRVAGFDALGCAPCHVTHARPDRVEPRLMWPLDGWGLESTHPGAVAEVAPEGYFAPTDRHCVLCHRRGGPVAPPGIATHPEVAMLNLQAPTEAGFLPLFDAQGAVSPMGRIGCRTCHLTHGREEAAPLTVAEQGLSEREIRARRYHIRSFLSQNVCTTCHGHDALRRFMYFHDPARRTGAVDGRPR